MSSGEQNKKSNKVLKVTHVNWKKKAERECYDVMAKNVLMVSVEASLSKP